MKLKKAAVSFPASQVGFLTGVTFLLDFGGFLCLL